MPPAAIRPVRGFPGYLVGSSGTVWTRWKTRRRAAGGRGVESFISSELKRLKGSPRKDGYVKVTLRKDGRAYDFLLHRLVLETFVGPCPEGMECLHKDSVKSNCRLSNLRWGTRIENVADSIAAGTHRRATEAAALVTRGIPRTEEAKAKIAAAHKGKPKSAEHIANLMANHWSRRADAGDIVARREATKRQRGNSGRPR